MLTLSNATLSLEMNETTGFFNIKSLDSRFPSLNGAYLGGTYSLRGKRQQLVSAHGFHLAEGGETTETEHGQMKILTYNLAPDHNHVMLQVTFGVADEYPLVMWKVKLTNRGEEPVFVDQIDLLRLTPEKNGLISYPKAKSTEELGFYSNGWQSWSPSGWYSGDSRMNLSKLGFLQHPMIYNPGTPLPRQKGVFSSDMFAVIGDRAARSGFVLGFLSQKNHFGSILANLNLGTLGMWANGDQTRLDPGKCMETDWAVFNPILLDHRAPLEKFLEAAARENHARIPAETPTGWCSWYHYYTRVTAQDVSDNLGVILEHQEEIPIQLVQIDDGFESQIGDWFSFKETFPEGVAPLADKIHGEGLIPGLWLAPFIVHPKARILRSHPEWVLKTRSGKPVNAGFVWNTLTTALDITIPEALDYACKVIRTAAEEWGYPYLKLDFLYAAALNCKYHDDSLTRAQVLRRGMEALRESMGDKTTFLACGAPLGSTLGIADLMRIGADVSGDWAPGFHGVHWLFKNEPGMPSARNSIRNILTRASLHRQWWVNDPDCLLVRPDTHLAIAEVHALATAIAMTGGSLLLSDDLTRLPDERMGIAAKLLPVTLEQVRVIDWFDAPMPERLRLDFVNQTGEWHVLAQFNWTEKARSIEITPEDFFLEGGIYSFKEFWAGELGILNYQSQKKSFNIPAHGCALLAVRRVRENESAYLGSDLHFSQGMEVSEWSSGNDGLEITLRLPRKATGQVFISIPAEQVKVVEVDGEAIEPDRVLPGILSIPVNFTGFSHIKIK